MNVVTVKVEQFINKKSNGDLWTLLSFLKGSFLLYSCAKNIELNLPFFFIVGYSRCRAVTDLMSIFCVQKEKDKNRNEIVLYFIYDRTFQYSDIVSLIYLFTNIYLSICPGLKTVVVY